MVQIMNDIILVDKVFAKEDMADLLENKGCFRVGKLVLEYEALVEKIKTAFESLIQNYAGKDLISDYLIESINECEKEIKRKKYLMDRLSESIVELKKNFMIQYLDRVKGVLSEKEFSDILEKVNCKKIKLERELSTLAKEEVQAIRKREKMKSLNVKECRCLNEESLCLFINKIEFFEKVDTDADGNQKTGIIGIITWNI